MPNRNGTERLISRITSRIGSLSLRTFFNPHADLERHKGVDVASETHSHFTKQEVERTHSRRERGAGEAGPRQKAKLKIPLDWEEHELFTKPGPANVIGHVFYLRPDKTLFVCSHSSIIAFPDTPFIREAIAIIRTGESPEVPDFFSNGNFRLYLHALCDLYGNFRFCSLQAARYFFAAEVSWLEDGKYQSGTLLSSKTIGPGTNFLVLTNVPL